MTDYRGLLEALVNGAVDFILVGGIAGVAHGSARLTQDLDVVYSRNQESIRRLVEALSPYEPYLRGAPAGLPFQLDAGRNHRRRTLRGSSEGHRRARCVRAEVPLSLA